MSLFDIFKKKKKEKVDESTHTPATEVSAPVEAEQPKISSVEKVEQPKAEPEVEIKTEEYNPDRDGIKPEDFKKWYEKLPESEKRKIDKKLEKAYFRFGTAVVCVKCGKPGGKIDGRGYTLKKIDKDRYVHLNGCPGG